MSSPGSDAPRPLDDGLYDLSSSEIEFLSSHTGIVDPRELKRHVLAIQEDIYKVHPYYCIRTFGFVSLGKKRQDALFLDLGCCVGTDIRRAIADGFPISQTLAGDLHAEFWEIGHKLYKSTTDSFPVPFIEANIFDPDCLAPSEIPSTSSARPLPPLASITMLTPLVGHLSVIHMSSFFHLFSEEQQCHLAKLIAPLLSSEPGSFIFGAHIGLPSKGLREIKNTHGSRMFCHSPESWKELWEEEIFWRVKYKSKRSSRSSLVRIQLYETIGGINWFGL